MPKNEDNSPEEVIRENLLRFLDSGPKILRWPAGRSLTHEGLATAASTPDCPEAHDFVQLVLGKLEGGEAERLLDHAAECDLCGNTLARGLSALEGDPSQEEIAAISELASSQPEWQDEMGRQLASTAVRRRPGFRMSRGWTIGGAIAAGVLLAAGLYAWRSATNTPEHQLAMAYQQSRGLELRIPEADYAPINLGHHTRGSGGNNEPAQLLDARARLARELERSPQDSWMLELQARADVLGERYDPAVDVLDRLIAQGPVTAELLTDAGTAYYQRGLVSGSELDRSTALDYLRRADQLAPTDPVILFNEAIVMEDRGQMMNAVEVWNRYLTVEHDAKWAEEGKRKLAQLEETLNRLKSHQSRIDQMLSTPQAMDALAGDSRKLASLDEELSSYDLDKLLLTAYPADGDFSKKSPQTRGSPCPQSCIAAHRLLKAIGTSLETQHHDSWLTDLVSPAPDTISSSDAETYRQGIRLLATAVSNDLSGSPTEAARLAGSAQQLFGRLAIAGSADAALRTGARVGDVRSAIEVLFALQRQQNFRECRTEAERFHARPIAGLEMNRYPWINAVAMITEKVCDDTPETRPAGRSLEMAALQLAESDHYRLLISRTKMRLVDDAQNAGDDETAERLTLASLRELLAADSPAYRIANTVGAIPYVEDGSPRRYMAELCERESLAWIELDGDHSVENAERMDLARAEMRIGAMKEAQHQLELISVDVGRSKSGKTRDSSYTESEIFLSKSLMEQGDLNGAARYLDQAASGMDTFSDTWALRTFAAARGQLALAQGKLDEAAKTLESEIRSSEGHNVQGEDPAIIAEYAQQDHDLYAELAATWLAQGRPAENVLTLWERFRLRSRGLPITPCRNGALDCDKAKLETAIKGLGNYALVGQVVLLDRVLIYHAESNGVTWSQKPLRQQDVMDAAQTFERAVSSPFTSIETAAKLGSRLSDALLSDTLVGFREDSILLLEPDPMLQNLSWPVLPTKDGPLGLRYPMAESRSILTTNDEQPPTSETICKRPLVVGASVAGGDEPPLPEALEEATSIGRLLHSHEVLLGKQATTTNLAELLGSATIFHFAGHAVRTINGTELRLSAASQGEKSPWVDGAFLRRHPPLHCQLAVLSACSTGMREASWKRPLQDIVETLGTVGVPQVVATRWQIDSQAAVPFMNAFYQELETGKSVAIALTLARRVQFGESVYKNPYYWGAYYVTGRDNSHLKRELHARL